MPELVRLGLENYDELLHDLSTHRIDCDLEQVGELDVALEPHQLEWLAEEVATARSFGLEAELLDQATLQAQVASPTYLGGAWMMRGHAVVDPGKLAEGLRQAVVRAGVRVFEQTSANALEPLGDAQMLVRTGGGTITARRVLLASGAHRSLLPAVRQRVAPVYDYVLVSEPLSAEQLAAIGWSRRQGIGDTANQF